MTDKKNHDERLERLMNQLAESVLGLSDEAIADTIEAEVDPEKEAERTRSVLRIACTPFYDQNNLLSNLGHAINPNDWQRGQGEYQNNCGNCGSSVSFTAATGVMQGEALNRQCPESDQYTIRKRKASR